MPILERGPITFFIWARKLPTNFPFFKSIPQSFNWMQQVLTDAVLTGCNSTWTTWTKYEYPLKKKKSNNQKPTQENPEMQIDT